MLSWIQHRWTGLYLLILALGALILFLYGFFPLKYHTGRMSTMDDLPMFIDGVSIDGQEIYKPDKTSVVLMVIDGLRYDFVTAEYMPFTGQLLANKSSCLYVTVAEPPTVTMPRIKSPERKKDKAQWRRTINFWRDIFAMMTGSVSTFADVALNFGAPAVRGDSVLRVAKLKGRRSVMYGDDTWLRLFPKAWSEFDGTTSFYVTDYTEVDNNVTRHLDKILKPDEEKNPPFDFLVLHYLGLDHIGHLEGARSPKIKPKLLEMDNVVKKIFTAMNTWGHEGVLLVGGDHGMRDAGGHGGATSAEILVPLVLAKSAGFQCPHDVVSSGAIAQVDLAPSVSWLLGAPIPGDSIGKLLPALLPSDTRQHLYLLHYLAKHNAKAVYQQFGAIAKDKEFYKQFRRAEKQFAQYLVSRQQSAAKLAKEFYDESLNEMTKYLSGSTVDFDNFAINLGMALIISIAMATICVTLYSLQANEKRIYSVVYHGRTRTLAGTIIALVFIIISISIILIQACALTETESNLCSLFSSWTIILVSVAIAFTVAFCMIKTSVEQNMNLTFLNELNAIDLLLIFGTLFHSWTFFGTSFIEEEHMTWYFFWNTLMFFVLIRTFVLVVVYFTKRAQGATEVQDKPVLEMKMTKGLTMLPKWVLLIALHRYLRTMNQTGDRWLFLPDTADWLNAPENSIYLQAHLIIGIFFTTAICLWNLRHTRNICNINTVLTILATLCILCYRIITESLPTPSSDILKWDTVQVVNVLWTLLIVQMILEVLTYTSAFKNCMINIKLRKIHELKYSKLKDKVEDFVYQDEPCNIDKVKLDLVRSVAHLALNDMMLIIILLMRPHNVIMVPSTYITCVLASQCLDHSLLDVKPGKRKDVLDTLSRCLVHIWIGIVFFFYQGNSNSLASVDLGAGYVGLRSYCPVRVAMRMGLHAYAGPALAGMTLFASLSTTYDTWEQYLQSAWRCTNILSFQRAYSLAIYIVVAFIFRHHLFVWTVFSPKLLYDFVATVFTIVALITMMEINGVAHLAVWFSSIFTIYK